MPHLIGDLALMLIAMTEQATPGVGGGGGGGGDGGPTSVLEQWGPTGVSGALLALFAWFIRHMVTVTLPGIQKDFAEEAAAHRAANETSRTLFADEAREQRAALREAIGQFREELSATRSEYHKQLASDREHHMQMLDRLYPVQKPVHQQEAG